MNSAVWLGCKRDETKENPRHDRKHTDAWFEEVAVASGVTFQHVSAMVPRYYFPEIMSGGVCLLDYDGDGFLDLYFVQGGGLLPSDRNPPGNRLYHNLRGGTFEDVTEQSGTGDTHYGMGCTCGDYDHDGDVDLYVTNVGPNVLFRNDGDGSFTDVTESAGVGDPGWGTSAAWTDYDGDGNLDLFVVNYVVWSPGREIFCHGPQDQRDYCSPSGYKAPAPDVLYHNTPQGHFENVRIPAGMKGVVGNGLGIAPADYNADGRIDFYVANDLNANHYWVNQGNGTFSEQALIAGCAVNHFGAPEAGMGVIAFDVDHNGTVDIFLSHLRNETNTLYLNRKGWFEDMTATSGLGPASIPFTGFGLGFADFDQDGNPDVFIANGRVRLAEDIPNPGKPYAEANLLFKGTADGRFEEVLPQGGTRRLFIEASRGAAFGDLDNDGDVDIVVVNSGARAHLLRNVAATSGHWIMFRVLNDRGCYALGASVRIQVGSNHQWRQVQRAYSYCSSNDPRVHFGLGTASRVDDVLVRWPGGTEEHFGPFKAGALYELRQGASHTNPNGLSSP